MSRSWKLTEIEAGEYRQADGYIVLYEGEVKVWNHPFRTLPCIPVKLEPVDGAVITERDVQAIAKGVPEVAA